MHLKYFGTQSHSCTNIPHDEGQLATGSLNESYHFVKKSVFTARRKKISEKISCTGEGDMDRGSRGFAGSSGWDSGDKAFSIFGIWPFRAVELGAM